MSSYYHITSSKVMLIHLSLSYNRAMPSLLDSDDVSIVVSRYPEKGQLVFRN